MMRKNPKVIMTDEAKEFLISLPVKAQEKIAYNVRKVEEGIIDNELYKKLEDTYIWELRILFNGVKYRLFTFWDTE